MSEARVIRIHETGGPDVLTEDTIALPPPGPGQVRVRNTAIGLNFIDTYRRSGLYPVELPAILGTEAAGLVEAVGEGVTALQPGQRVAWMGGGAYASHSNIPEQSAVPLPDYIDDETAAAVLLKGLTCWMLLFRVHRASPGDAALVWAAAGGVGSLLVPWAASLGVKVIGIVSTQEKAERVMNNGASHVLLSDDDIPGQVIELTGGTGVDVAYDSVGKLSAEASLKSLRRRGLFVTYGNASGPVDPIAPARLAMGGSLVMTRPSLFDFFETPDAMARGSAALFGALRTGTIKADIGQRFALSDVADAHRALEGRKTVGATVLVP